MAAVVVTPPTTVQVSDIVQLAQYATGKVSQVRSRMLSPDITKKAPSYTAAQVAELCGISKDLVQKRLAKGDLPSGSMVRNRREFTLAETRAWARAYLTQHRRPAGRPGFVVSVSNFKGGVGKTTTAMTLAQGLSRRGLDVTLVDLDPQGSTTTLCGYLPDIDIVEEDTVALICADPKVKDLDYAVRPTYWDGISLIPACPSMSSAEFALPARQKDKEKDNEPDFNFWEVIDRGLAPIKARSDVVIIDTPPALGYLTVNAMMAADGIIVPMPPNALDYASSAQFWTLFADLIGLIDKQCLKLGLPTKEYAFLNILLSKVDTNDVAYTAVREWILATYGARVMPVEIPKTTVTTATAATFGTVYDIARYEGSSKTYARAYDAYTRFVEMIEASIHAHWTR